MKEKKNPVAMGLTLDEGRVRVKDGMDTGIKTGFG